MSLKLCVLASGSVGNCTYVGSDKTHILIDAGLSGKETARRLELAGSRLEQICAVCLTHEHDDHRSALGVLQRRGGVAIYANTATVDFIEGGAKGGLDWTVFTTGEPFEIGELRLEPFSVPHDSYDPVGFVVSNGGARVAVVTDMGMATGLVRERLKDCDAIVIETNHDEELLKNSNRPWSLKQRILSRQGHLSNAQAAELVAEVAGPRLRAVFLAHLSAECNRPHLAVRAVEQALAKAGASRAAVHLTYPDRGSETFMIGEP